MLVTGLARSKSAVVERSFGRLLGLSVAMRRLYPVARRLAEAHVPVVIEGETGTGKEVLAEAIHHEGNRTAGPFVVFDCTTVAPTMLEAELFGHERGAFTGALTSRRGVFEQAHGGTLFIDELGELPIEQQARLLRAIERSTVRRVGGDTSRSVDVRVIAATRRDLNREVHEGRFRDDLFHRLAVGRIELPPLREREGDVVLLAHHFWRELGGGRRELPLALLRRWEGARWPGNVRELRNTVARHLALGEVSLPEPARSPLRVVEERPAPGSPDAGSSVFADVLDRGLSLPEARAVVVAEFERAYLARALAEHQGNVARAAAASGVAGRYFRLLRSRHLPR